MSKASVYFSMGGLPDRHDMQAIKRELDALPGVQSVSVSQTGRIAVDYDTTGTDAARIAGQLQKAGYAARPCPGGNEAGAR